VAEPRHDFGRRVQGDTLRHAFVTLNPTMQTIEIENPREVLGCSGVALPRLLPPGGTGKLEVSCRAAVYGPLRVALPLRANGTSAGELLLSGEIEPLLVFEHALLEVNVGFEAAGSAETRLRGSLASAARLVLLSTLPDGMTSSVLAASEPGPQGVALRVSHAAPGTHAGSLRFATGLAEPAEVELAYLVKVESTLAVSPSNPVLHLGAPKGAQTVVTVTSRSPNFRVERVEVPDGPFAAELRRDGGVYAIELSVVAEKLAPGQHGANGRLIIVSNDRAEPRKEVPLFAMGSVPGG
jgi:hypothetical protein